MLYRVRCNPVQPLYGVPPVLYVPGRVTRGALVAQQYTNAPPRCRTSQYSRTFIPLSVNSRTFIPLSVSLRNDLADPVFDGVDCQVSRSEPMIFFTYAALSLRQSSTIFSFSLLSVCRLLLGYWGLRTERISLSLSFSLPTSFNNNNNNSHIDY